MKKLTPNQQEWFKIQTDILRNISKLKSKGINVSDFQIPNQPQYISKKNLESLKRQLKEIDSLNINETPQPVDLNNIESIVKSFKNSTADIKTGRYGSYYPNERVIAMQNILEELKHINNDFVNHFILDIFNDIISQKGFFFLTKLYIDYVQENDDFIGYKYNDEIDDYIHQVNMFIHYAEEHGVEISRVTDHSINGVRQQYNIPKTRYLVGGYINQTGTYMHETGQREFELLTEIPNRSWRYKYGR